MNAAEIGSGGRVGAPEPPTAIDRFCGIVDRVNFWIGRAWGLTIVAVTAAVIYEVVARTVFQRPTIWSNEVTIYLSAMAYLIAGGYAHLYRRHVRIDVVYDALKPQTRTRLDIFTFIFFAAYVGTLAWVGADMAWQSFEQSEGTGTPWNPPIWPVKAVIPIAGLLLLLQGIANLLRDIGWAHKAAP